MKIISFKENNLEKIINQTLTILKNSGLVIFPSDTVYGALVDATNEISVRKLIKFKTRPPGKAISVFVYDIKMVQEIVEVNKDQLKIVEKILPGPFTVVLRSKHKTSELLESEKGTLGIRIPMNRFIGKLVRRYGRPITATSANLSGYPPHYSIASLLNRLPETKKKLIDLIVDVGKLPRNKPSTVVDLTQPQIKILRQGEVIFGDQSASRRTYLSKTPGQTKKIAQFLVNKLLLKSELKPLIIIIEGELGVGKTVFIKGIGELLGITEIISPSFVIYYEYSINHPRLKKLIHLDLYNIEEKEEFKYLGIKSYLKPKNLLCFEWGEKAGEILDQLKDKGEIVYVKMKYVNDEKREIEIKS